MKSTSGGEGGWGGQIANTVIDPTPNEKTVEGITEHFIAQCRKAETARGLIDISYEHLRELLSEALTSLSTQALEEKKELVKRADMEIYALESTLEKSKELSVAVGHKRVYERIKLISEYKGKLEAWKEIKALAERHNITMN